MTSIKEKMHAALWNAAQFTDPQNAAALQDYLRNAMSKNNIAVDSVCEDGCNIGFYVAAIGNVNLLNVCERLGVDLFHRNHKGESALFYLFASAPMLYLVEPATHPKECMDVLLKTCSLTQTNIFGQTPLFGLRKMTQKGEMFARIMEGDLRGLKPSDVPDYIEHYEKLLHCAVERGADITHKDQHGRCFVDPDPSDTKLNELLALFVTWRDKIDQIVLTKEVSIETQLAISKTSRRL